jgi:hypothetical protein
MTSDTVERMRRLVQEIADGGCYNLGPLCRDDGRASTTWCWACQAQAICDDLGKETTDD